MKILNLKLNLNLVARIWCGVAKEKFFCSLFIITLSLEEDLTIEFLMEQFFCYLN